MSPLPIENPCYAPVLSLLTYLRGEIRLTSLELLQCQREFLSSVLKASTSPFLGRLVGLLVGRSVCQKKCQKSVKNCQERGFETFIDCTFVQ